VDPFKKISKSYFKGMLPKFSKKTQFLESSFPFQNFGFLKKVVIKIVFPFPFPKKKVV